VANIITPREPLAVGDAFRGDGGLRLDRDCVVANYDPVADAFASHGGLTPPALDSPVVVRRTGLAVHCKRDPIRATGAYAPRS
jgi:hypothetical protein